MKVGKKIKTRVAKNMSQTTNTNVGDKIFRNNGVEWLVTSRIFNQMLALKQLTDSQYIDLPDFAHVLVTETAIKNIDVGDYSQCDLLTLCYFIRVCNFVGWDTKLPHLHRVVAKVLSNNQKPHTSPVNMNLGYATLNLSSVEFQHLYYLRCNYFGTPQTNATSCNHDEHSGLIISNQSHVGTSNNQIGNKKTSSSSELDKLLYTWWLYGQCDPTVITTTIPTCITNGVVNMDCVLSLEYENIREILLFADYPTYDVDEWLRRHNSCKPITLCTIYKFPNIDVPFNNFVVGNFFMDHDAMEFINSENAKDMVDHQYLCGLHKNVMTEYCDRYDPILKMVHMLLVMCWCKIVYGATNNDITIINNFNVDLYMLRFPKPQKVNYYNDVISVNLDDVTDMAKQVLTTFNFIPIPPSYQLSKDLLLSCQTHNKTKNNNIVTTLMSKVKLRLKSDVELKLLCDHRSISYFEYDRQTAIDVLSRHM